MAVKQVGQNSNNVEKGSFLYELARIVNQLQVAVEELKTDFNLHTHRADGAQAGAYNTSKPQSDTQTVVPVTAVAVAATTPDSISFRDTGAPS